MKFPWNKAAAEPAMAGGVVSLTAGRDPVPAAASPSQLTKWYLKEAQRFEQSKLDAQKQMTRLALWAAAGGVVIGVAGLLSAAALVMVKRPNPPAVLRVSETTGTVDVLGVVRDGKVDFGEKTDRADLRRYVEMRESYDWETIQSMFDTVMNMTADGERDQYNHLVTQPNAPVKVLKNEARVIARVGAITFVGTTAQVFFSKELVPLSGAAARKTEYWVATIAYRHDNLPERGSKLESNPTGFKVISYTVDRDWTRTPVASVAAPVVSTALATTGIQPPAPAPVQPLPAQPSTQPSPAGGAQ